MSEPGGERPRADQASAAADLLAAEFLVEPFAEGEPGDHVHAALAAFERRGLSVDLGPFASVSSGDADSIADAVADMIREAMAAGATSIRIHVGEDLKTLHIRPLHDALETMVRAAERDLGVPSDRWGRAEKQRAVRMMDEQGAFLLRGAVDDIARIMGVSRITIYNYLNAIERG
ncbi:MAG: helix-turn-helix domain-containing protein [Actinomycetota bacterium]